jgi:hypothetical protein
MHLRRRSVGRKKKDVISSRPAESRPAQNKKEPRTVYVGTTPVVLTDPNSINTTLRLTYPKMGEAADYKNSRSYAIKGKCLDCSGGNRSAVATCPVQACFLWSVRPFKDDGHKVRDAGVIPTRAEYQNLHEAKESKYDRSAALAALDALAKSRDADDDDEDDNDSDVEIEYE